MQHNNLRATFYFLLPIFFVLASCKPPQPEIVPSSTFTGGLESNDWFAGCSNQGSGGYYAVSSAQISSGAYTADLTAYSDSGCTTSTFKIVETGTYTFTATGSGSSGTVDWTLGTYDITPLSSARATSYNTSSFCGYSDWQANVAKSVLARTCGSALMPSAGDIKYDIYSISEISIPNLDIQMGDLRFGYNDTTHDGSTPAERPTSYSGNLVYRQ